MSIPRHTLCGSSAWIKNNETREHGLIHAHRVLFVVPKGKKAIFKEHAEKCGESVNAFMIRAAEEAIAREQSK